MFNTWFAPLPPFTRRYCHSLSQSFTKLLPCLCFTCGTHERRCCCAHTDVCINSLRKFFWISLCCSGNSSSKYGIMRAKNSNIKPTNIIHFFAKSSISSCFIQKTRVFITLTCCTLDTEPTAARNKHSCVNTIPLSIYITSSSVSMQIKLMPHRGPHWHCAKWSHCFKARWETRSDHYKWL